MISIWAGWLLALITCLAILGAKALMTGMRTLSRYNWNAFQAWPPIAVAFGMVFPIIRRRRLSLPKTTSDSIAGAGPLSPTFL